MKQVFADMFNPGVEQREAVDIAQGGKVFPRVLWEISHWILVVGHGIQHVAMPQRTSVSEEVSVGAREDHAFHPPFVVAFVD